MNELSTLPSRLPPILTNQGAVSIERIQSHHAEPLHKAGVDAAPSVHPWLGKTLCPVSLRNAHHTIKQLEHSRQLGFGITYLLMYQGRCLGMGLINYIHPIHQCANLGYWMHPSARGQGLAKALCNRLITLAFEQMSLIRLELYIESDNDASIHLAHKLNAVKEGLCRKRVFGRDALLYAITR
ncbi:N-acetyltransferase [Alteromonas sediminis]|uniref:N-acetyltransferase n=1 Tax=Alteromonas sediminis TaxID=2259342 RepID=A0A3N5XWD8_9ALTE|nr:N-acetyltransferase [Alteromonas sediminis]